MKLKRSIRLLSLFNFLTDFSLFAPIAIIYFSRVSGSFARGMSVFAIIMFTSALLQIPTGIFSDRIGRKQTIIVGAFFDVVSAVCYAIGLSYGWLVFGAICSGVARSLFSGNNEAYLHDILLDHEIEGEYHEYLGKVSSMFQVALAISALLGSLIAQWSFHLVLWLTVVPALLKLIIGFLLVPSKKRESQGTTLVRHLREAMSLFWTNKQLRLLSIAGMLDYAIGESAYQFRGAFIATLWPVWAIGVASMLSNIGAAISFYFSGKLIKRYKELPVIIIGTIYGKIVAFVALLFPGIGSPAIMTTTSLFFGVQTVAEENLMQKEFTEHQRATMGSLNSLGGSLCMALFALFLGFIADKVSPVGGLLLFQLFSLVPLTLFLVLFYSGMKRARRV